MGGGLSRGELHLDNPKKGSPAAMHVELLHFAHRN